MFGVRHWGAFYAGLTHASIPHFCVVVCRPRYAECDEHLCRRILAGLKQVAIGYSDSRKCVGVIRDGPKKIWPAQLEAMARELRLELSHLGLSCTPFQRLMTLRA